MTWTINPEPVCGGISIIDENDRGVAIVIQRDPHPALGQGVTLEEAERRARVMVVAHELLEALEAFDVAAKSSGSIIGFAGKALPLLKQARSAIAKARGEE